MARFDISMLGDKALSETLAALPEKLERRVLTKALRNVGKFYLTLAKAKAPKETGALSQGLTLRSLKRKRGRVGVLIQTPTREALGIVSRTRISFAGTGERLRVVRGKTTGYYPAHQELGTQHLPPTPYLRGTLQEKRQTLLNILRLEIDTGIERELVKGR